MPSSVVVMWIIGVILVIEEVNLFMTDDEPRENPTMAKTLKTEKCMLPGLDEPVWVKDCQKALHKLQEGGEETNGSRNR